MFAYAFFYILMFKNPFQIAIIFALVSLVIKLIFKYTEVPMEDVEQYTIFILMFITLVTVYLGRRSNRYCFDRPTTYKEDFKTGARTGAFYSVLLGVITYIYYNNIDPEYFAIKIQGHVDQILETFNDNVNELGREKAVENANNRYQSAKMIFAPYFHSTITLFSFMFLGLLNALLMTIVHRKIAK